MDNPTLPSKGHALPNVPVQELSCSWLHSCSQGQTCGNGSTDVGMACIGILFFKVNICFFHFENLFIDTPFENVLINNAFDNQLTLVRQSMFFCPLNNLLHIYFQNLRYYFESNLLHIFFENLLHLS